MPEQYINIDLTQPDDNRSVLIGSNQDAMIVQVRNGTINDTNVIHYLRKYLHDEIAANYIEQRLRQLELHGKTILNMNTEIDLLHKEKEELIDLLNDCRKPKGFIHKIKNIFGL